MCVCVGGGNKLCYNELISQEKIAVFLRFSKYLEIEPISY